MSNPGIQLWVECIGIPSLRAGITILALLFVQSGFRWRISSLSHSRLCLLLHFGLLLPGFLHTPLSWQNWFFQGSGEAREMSESRQSGRGSPGGFSSNLQVVSGVGANPSASRQDVMPADVPIGFSGSQIGGSEAPVGAIQEEQKPFGMGHLGFNTGPVKESFLQSASISVIWILVWAAGTFGLLTVAFVGSYRVLRRCRVTPAVQDPAILTLLDECRNQVGYLGKVALRSAAWVPSHFLVGVLRPVILLPERMITSLSRDQLRFVFLHEMAHAKRLDVLWNCFGMILQSLHWFNPLVWIGLSRFRNFREMVCDQMVLEVSAPGSAQAYGRTMLRLLEENAWCTANGMGIGAGTGNLRWRLEGIARFRKWKPSVTLAVTAASLIFLVCLTDATPSSSSRRSPSFRAAGTGVSVAVWDVRGDIQVAKAGPDGAIQLGGIVTDAAGNPLESIRVHVRPLRFESNAGAHPMAAVSHGHSHPGYSTLTDRLGRWGLQEFPEEVDGVQMELSRPNGATVCFSCLKGDSEQTAGSGAELDWDSFKRGHGILVMSEGDSVRGRVVDSVGRPIVGAEVREGVGLFLQHRSSVVTDASGRFEFPNRTQVELLLTADAPGFAMSSQRVDVGSGRPEVRMVLLPARPVDLLVIDGAGSPVVDAIIRSVPASVFQQEFLNPGLVHQFRAAVDKGGRWRMVNAPLDGVSLMVSSGSLGVERIFRIGQGCTNATLRLKPAKEDVIRIRGNVRGVDTGLLKEKAVVSYRLPVDPQFVLQSEFTDGHFEFAIPRVSLQLAANGLPFQLRVQSPGYAVWFSEWCYSSQGDREFEVVLPELRVLKGQLVLPDGTPARGAEFRLNYGRPENDLADADALPASQSGIPAWFKADESGSYALEDSGDAAEVLITHERGFLRASLWDLRAGTRQKLHAWGEIAGTVRAGMTTGLNRLTGISIFGVFSGAGGWPVHPGVFQRRIFRKSTLLDADGRFIFPRLFPGKYVVQLEFELPGPGGSPATFCSHAREVQIQSGKQAFVEFGKGSGQELSVVGSDRLANSDVLFIEPVDRKPIPLRVDQFVNWETHLQKSLMGTISGFSHPGRYLLNQVSPRLFVGQGIPSGDYHLYRRVVNQRPLRAFLERPATPAYRDIKLDRVNVPPSGPGESHAVIQLRE